jgi:hypothetical protein
LNEVFKMAGLELPAYLGSEAGKEGKDVKKDDKPTPPPVPEVEKPKK